LSKYAGKETPKSAPEQRRESQEDGQQGERNTEPRATPPQPQTQYQQALWRIATALLLWMFQESRGERLPWRKEKDEGKEDCVYTVGIADISRHHVQGK
jgi:hypothetical protein